MRRQSREQGKQPRKRGVFARIFLVAIAPARLMLRSVLFFSGADEIKAQVNGRVARYRRVAESAAKAQAESPETARQAPSAQQRLDGMSRKERLDLIDHHISVQWLCCAALWVAFLSVGYGIATLQVLSGLAAASWAICMFVLSAKRAWTVHVMRSGRVSPFLEWLRSNLEQPFWPLSRSE